MHKFGVEMDQLSPHGQAAARSAERNGARTIIYRDKVPVAAIVSLRELDRLAPADPGEDGDDPLLSLCGTFNDDAFVDSLSKLGQTGLFLREDPPTTQQYGGKGTQEIAVASPEPSAAKAARQAGVREVPARSGSTLKPPPVPNAPPKKR